MKKIYLIIAIVIFLLVLAGAGAFAYISKQQNNPTNKEVVKSTDNKVETLDKSSSQTEPQDVEEQKSSLLSLLSSDKSQVCVYNFDKDNVKGQGKVYVSNKKARASTEVLTGDISIESNMISDGKTMYMWGNGYGAKMDLADLTKMNEKYSDLNPQQKAQVESFRNDMKVDCKPWVEDTSYFEIPKDIKFSDMSELFKNIQSMTPNNKVGTTASGANNSGTTLPDNLFDQNTKVDPKSLCSICDSFTGDIKAKCLSRYNCK